MNTKMSESQGVISEVRIITYQFNTTNCGSNLNNMSLNQIYKDFALAQGGTACLSRWGSI